MKTIRLAASVVALFLGLELLFLPLPIGMWLIVAVLFSGNVVIALSKDDEKSPN